MKREIDEIDQGILLALQKNADLSNLQLSEKIGLSPSACSRRVDNLKKNRVIKGSVTQINIDRIGNSEDVFVLITLNGQKKENLEAFEEKIRAVREVMSCYLMTGISDYLLRLIVRDVSHYKEVHQKLTDLPSVQRVQTSFAMKEVIKKTQIPLDRILEK